MKENNKKSISAFLSFIAISFFGGNTITNAVQTTNEYPAPLSSTVDYSAKKLVRPLSYVNQCKNNTNQNLSFLALNKSKTIPFDTNLTKPLSFSHGLSRAFLYSARYDQEDYYLDFLFTLSQKQDEHSLLEFLEHTYHGFMTNMILTLNFDNKTEKSKTYTNKKTIDFRKALLEKEKESTKNLPKELSDIDRQWVKMGKMDLLNTLTSFFNLQKDKWKACQISFRHNSDIHTDIHTVAISYNESWNKYSYYDSNEKNGVHLIGWPAPAHLITSHYTQCGNDETFEVMLFFHFDDTEKRKGFNNFFFAIQKIYDAQKTTVSNPTKTHPVLRSPIDFRQCWLTPQLNFLRECTNTINEKLSLALKDEEKIKTMECPTKSQEGFCGGLTRCLMHYGMQGLDYLNQYLDFLSTLITKRDKDSLLEFLKYKKNCTIANKILKFQKNSQQYQQSQNAINKKNQNSNEEEHKADFYSVYQLKETKNEKKNYFEILKENPQKPYRRDIKIKKRGLEEILSEFFKPETPGRKGCSVSLTTDDKGGGHVVGILRENSSDKYLYYDANNSQLVYFSNLNEIVETVVNGYHDVKKSELDIALIFYFQSFNVNLESDAEIKFKEHFDKKAKEIKDLAQQEKKKLNKIRKQITKRQE